METHLMKVPFEFQKPIKVEYPKHNKIIFEQWLIDNLGHYNSERQFLPINWCGYFVNHNYGNDTSAMQRLNRYLMSLDKNKKYFTSTQYDLGIITPRIDNIDIKVFGSGGGRIDYPIPLICHPHVRRNNERDIFASFIGSKTHQIRNEILRIYSDHSNWVITDLNYDIDTFCDVLSRSVFALCPRGFGLTSFRICEALEQGSIPVYISDQFIIPGNVDFENYGVLIHSSRIEEIDQILASISQEEIAKKQEYGKMIYEKMYTFEGCRQLIIDNI